MLIFRTAELNAFMTRSISNLTNYYAFQAQLESVPKEAVLCSIAIDSIVDLLPSLDLTTINQLFLEAADTLLALEERFADVTVGYVGTGEYFIYANSETPDLMPAISTILKRLRELEIHVGGCRDYKIKVKVRCGFSKAISRQPIQKLAYECKVALLSANINGPFPHQYNSTNPLTSARIAGTYNIARALQKRELFAVFQPKIDLNTGKIIGAEALIRWLKDGKLVSPLTFIPAAERTFEILLIGDFMLEQSKLFAEQLAPTDDFSLSINLSPKQLEFNQYLNSVATSLADMQAPKVKLEFEITEQAKIDMAYAHSFLKRLRDLGAELCIDDFGTGYSSFYYLCDIEARTLKIDRSLTSRVLTSNKVARVVASIFKLAKNLGFQTVAEGIENHRESEWMREHGCDFGQGFFFHRPLTFEAFKRVYNNR